MKKIVFSDIDGTLAHYPKHFEDFAEIIERDESTRTAIYRDKNSGEERLCNILPSSTGLGDAYISKKTIELIDEFRREGMLFALVSGMRKSTYKMRIPLLPEADFGIVENGGIIYEKNELDRKWPMRFLHVTGPIETEKAPEEREGLLWDLYRKLKKKGFDVDARDYSACVRVSLKNAEENNLLKNICIDLPRDISAARNLGKVDFYPQNSGKGNAVRYIMEKEHIKKEESIALFDDDNDLPMAEAVGTAMLPGISHESVHLALKKHPDWIISKNKGILGTEEILKIVSEL
ncbi:HAD family phosphatase [Candidatus Peregrinibacteria bacterium]|nr:HAD family phosphatase [Candidatus Peregrinibacteria bacterium]